MYIMMFNGFSYLKTNDFIIIFRKPCCYFPFFLITENLKTSLSSVHARVNVQMPLFCSHRYLHSRT